MHFTEIRLTNFGQYNDEHVLDLRPQSEGLMNDRPVILIGGKNGAGKTTLLESVRLALYGADSLGMGTNRQAYETYLLSRIHRQLGSPLKHMFAGVGVTFEHASDGTTHTFHVRRMWERQKRGVAETFTVLRDGRPLASDEYVWWYQFLHELLPPGLADLFFFDGEKIQSLADDPNYTALGQAISALLGLDLLERLRADLHVYVLRQKRAKEPGLAQQQAALDGERATIEETFSTAYLALASTRREIAYKEKQVEDVEQQLERKGGRIVAQHDGLRLRAEALLLDMRRYERQIEEQASGLLPFAVIPQLCDELRDHLLVEEQIAQIAIAREIRDALVEETLGRLVRDDQWLNGVTLAGTDRANLVAGLTNTLHAAAGSVAGVDAEPTVPLLHDLARQERMEIFGWLQQATTTIPQTIGTLGTELEAATEELARIEATLLAMPADEIVQPILQQLAALHQEIGVLKAREAEQEREVNRINLQRDGLTRREQELLGRALRGDDPASRLQLAQRSQEALVKYEESLRRAKITDLEGRIVECFGRLSRKGPYIKRVTIDPTTFETSLFNSKGDALPKEQLSAGEKQMYAIAVLWALRVVSGRSLPIIIDTPLGRLDSEHRQRLVEHYFPHASHQVVLLSTDTEIDADLYAALEPATARVYQLVYQPRSATTTITEGYFWATDAAPDEAESTVTA